MSWLEVYIPLDRLDGELLLLLAVWAATALTGFLIWLRGTRRVREVFTFPEILGARFASRTGSLRLIGAGGKGLDEPYMASFQRSIRTPVRGADGYAPVTGSDPNRSGSDCHER